MRQRQTWSCLGRLLRTSATAKAKSARLGLQVVTLGVDTLGGSLAVLPRALILLTSLLLLPSLTVPRVIETDPISTTSTGFLLVGLLGVPTGAELHTS